MGARFTGALFLKEHNLLDGGGGVAQTEKMQ